MDNERKTESRSKRRWSAMDTVITILLVAAVVSLAGRVVYAYRNRSHTDVTHLYTVEFEVASIQTENLRQIEAFDVVYVYESGAMIGYIGAEEIDGVRSVAIHAKTPTESAESSEETLPEETGIEVAEGLPPIFTGHTEAYGSMICAGGELEDGCLYAANAETYIAPGTELTVCTDKVLFTLRVLSITEKQP